MLPAAARLIVSVFDMHSWPLPLTKVSDYRPDFQFMAANVGGASNGSPALAVAGSFRVFPVPAEDNAHHFWGRYGQVISAVAAPGLLPLRCRPINYSPRFECKGLPSAQVYVTVWLWPFGWSSQIELRWGGPISFTDAKAIQIALASRSEPVLKMGGRMMTVTELFKDLRTKIHADVIAAKPIEKVRVSQRTVTGFIAAPGAPFDQFAPFPRLAAARQWPDVDRAEIGSLLVGRAMSVAECNGFGKPGNSFKTVWLRRSNYALTHPQHGALLMMQHATDSNWRRGAQHCLIGNVRASLLTWAALSSLSDNSALAARNPFVQPAATVREVLRDNYVNPIFKELSQHLAA